MMASVSTLKVVYFKDLRDNPGTKMAIIINSKAWIPLSSVNIVMARVASSLKAPRDTETLLANHQQVNTAT